MELLTLLLEALIFTFQFFEIGLEKWAFNKYIFPFLVEM